MSTVESRVGHREPTAFPDVSYMTGAGMGFGKRGTLIASGDSLEFRGEGVQVPLAKVRTVSFSRADGRLIVEYGVDGAPLQTAEFVDLSRGVLHARAATRDLEQRLRSAITLTAPTAEEEAAAATTRHRPPAGQRLVAQGVGWLVVAAIVLVIWLVSGDFSGAALAAVAFFGGIPLVAGSALLAWGLAMRRR